MGEILNVVCIMMMIIAVFVIGGEAKSRQNAMSFAVLTANLHHQQENVLTVTKIVTNLHHLCRYGTPYSFKNSRPSFLYGSTIETTTRRYFLTRQDLGRRRGDLLHLPHDFSRSKSKLVLLLASHLLNQFLDLVSWKLEKSYVVSRGLKTTELHHSGSLKSCTRSPFHPFPVLSSAFICTPDLRGPPWMFQI
ncbi:hypothetical protein Bca52824_019874 [Brassica carinata]|uniref:Uncharacterized protein n=1 Tax=Brassica carinata TaxID=52824 RepID=A0A8X8B0T9_BRACI|nr:hypothetical protein Bca52824_019874 [Brassica carinata]